MITSPCPSRFRLFVLCNFDAAAVPLMLELSRRRFFSFHRLVETFDLAPAARSYHREGPRSIATSKGMHIYSFIAIQNAAGRYFVNFDATISLHR